MERVKAAKKPFKIVIVLINMLLLVIYSIAIKASGDEGLDILMEDMMLVIAHIVLCFTFAFFYYPKEFVLSALLILLIGCATCWFVPTIKLTSPRAHLPSDNR